MTSYVIQDQKLIDALWESGIPCFREEDEYQWFSVDLLVDHGERVCLPNGLFVVCFGTGLYLVGRIFLPGMNEPDAWYRATFKIADPLLPDLIREAGYLCNCVAMTESGVRWYEVNFPVSTRKDRQLSKKLTVGWSEGSHLVRKGRV